MRILQHPRAILTVVDTSWHRRIINTHIHAELLVNTTGLSTDQSPAYVCPVIVCIIATVFWDKFGSPGTTLNRVWDFGQDHIPLVWP